MSRFLGITRERVFSPGRVEDDAAVLRGVAEVLRERDHDVDVFDGDSDAWQEPRPGTVVFAMCQGPRALAHLMSWERRGIRILNRPEGILNCQRHRTIPLLTAAGVGLPESELVDSAQRPSLPAWIDEAGAWIKRGDVHATEADDVVHVTGADAAVQGLRRFHERGIAKAVVQRHIPGVVIKFYAVRGSFFHAVRNDDGVPREALDEVDRIGQVAAARLGVEIYGGDCVYGKRGDLHLIDLNDWPSYRPCRASAARAIAAYLEAQKEVTRQ